EPKEWVRWVRSAPGILGLHSRTRGCGLGRCWSVRKVPTRGSDGGGSRSRRHALEHRDDAFEVAADIELALGGGPPGFEIDLLEAGVLFLHALDEAPLAGLEAEFTAGGE